MRAIPMFDVMPVTGANRDRGRTCYVCKLGSAPVVAAFIRPDSDEAEDLLEALEVLTRSNPTLRSFVVFLTPEDEETKNGIRTLAERKHLTIPLTLLPQGGLPPSLGVDIQADNTLLFYRGRQLFAHVENVNLKKENNTMELHTYFSVAGGDVMSRLHRLATAITSGP